MRTASMRYCCLSIAYRTHGNKSGLVVGLVREAHQSGRNLRNCRYKHELLLKKQSMITTDKLNWYAAYTRVNQELVIKKKLDELGVENYLPQEERVRETPLGRKKIRVILIHGMIFIRTDKATSFSLLNDHLLNIVYLKDCEERRSLIIPDKQMEDFMFLLDFSTDGVEVLNKDLKEVIVYE